MRKSLSNEHPQLEVIVNSIHYNYGVTAKSQSKASFELITFYININLFSYIVLIIVNFSNRIMYKVLQCLKFTKIYTIKKTW